jgi:dihydroorotase
MTDYVITGSQLLGKKAGNIAISQGVFVEEADLAGRTGVRVIDASGLVALPGFVDMHTHLRQPGMEHAETVLSGSQAAALGGYTAVHAMANTEPVADTASRTDRVHQWGIDAGYATVRPVGAVTKGLLGEELADIQSMARGVAAVRVFSDDGKCVSDSLLMRQALHQAKSVGAVIAQHAQDPRLTLDAQMNDGPLATELDLVGWPSVAEESIIARDVLLAESVGARLHVCHLSTAGAVDVVRWAKNRGIAVTAEVTPHHLLLTENLVATRDPLFKVNPPLRQTEDTLALRAAVAEGVIDIVATDHAPHPGEAKNCGFETAAFGMLGLETALAVVLETLVKPGHLSLSDIARVMSIAPAAIAAVSGYQKPLAVGEPAHLVLCDPQAETPSPRGSLSANNPYRGMKLSGRVLHTFHRGQQTVNDGDLVTKEHRKESGSR